MNLNSVNKLIYIKIFVFFAWMSMWISINSMPGEILYMNKDIITFINGMRTIVAIFFSILTIILATCFLIKSKKKLKNNSIVLIIFFIYFASQLIGLSLNPDRLIDLNNIYLVLYGICTISILYIVKEEDYQNLIQIFIYFMIFILFASVVFIFVTNLDNISKVVSQKNFYYLLHPDLALNYQAPPRITGFSRTISVINIFLIIIYLINYKKIFSIPLVFIIFVLSTFIWLSQSRGTIICFYTSSAILLFFFNDLSIIRKILLYSVITIFSIIGGNVLTSSELFKDENKKVLNDSKISIDKNSDQRSAQLSDESKSKLDETIFKLDSSILSLDKSRFYTQKNTSGRTALWRESLIKYNKKLIFGYGPQADRILLEDNRDKYGNNVSNAMIYALLSGGYPSLICIISIYIYFAYVILSFFFKRKLYNFSYNLNNKNSLFIVSMTFAIFFLLRSAVENSFSLFSTDFLITILSLFIMEKFKNKNFS